MNMWSRLTRLRHLDTNILHHTEWSKSIGSVAICAFLASVGFPLGIFLLIPHCARDISGPSITLSVLMAFVVAILTGLHLVEMIGRYPKSGCTYTFVYVTFGELWAFLCAWMTVIDYCAMSAYLAKSWSSHFDFMFHGDVKKYMNHILYVDDRLMKNQSNYANQLDQSISDHMFKDAVLDEHMDMLAAVGVLVAALVGLLGVSVIATISLSLLIVGALVVSSSILVGMFYANVMNWVQHSYFVNGFEGVCKASCILLRSMIGLEMMGSLVEETINAQNQLAFLLPIMNVLLFVYLFVTSIILTLIIPYSEIPFDAPLPSVYGRISVAASRYVLSVGSVCSLSGALLTSLVPSMRYLHTLGVDGLLCGVCSKFSTSIPNTPVTAYVTSVILTMVMLFVDSDSLLSILRILLPLRFVLLTATTLLQRYSDTQSGLFAQVANYKAVQLKSKSTSSFFGANTSGNRNGAGSSMSSRNVSDRYSISSSFIVRNIATAQYDPCYEYHDDDRVLFERANSKKRKHRRALMSDDEDGNDQCDITPLDEEVTVFKRAPSRSITGEFSALLENERINHSFQSINLTDRSKDRKSIKTDRSIDKESIKIDRSIDKESIKIDGRNLTDQSIDKTSIKIDGRNWTDQSIDKESIKTDRRDQSIDTDLMTRSIDFQHDPSMATFAITDVMPTHSHNCLRSPCSPTQSSDPLYHLYQREEPEGMPYCDTFSMYTPSCTANEYVSVYSKAKLRYALCLCTHLASAICLVRGWSQLETNHWWMYLVTALSFSAAIAATISLAWVPQNVQNQTKHQVPGVPYLALINTFLLCLMLVTVDFGGVWKISLLLVIALLIYAIYGYRHSVESRRSLYVAPQTSQTNENTGLVASLSAYQMNQETKDDRC